VTPPRATVFVVDDDASVRDALGSLIRSVGLQVRLFGSAHEFLGSSKSESPACLVLDVRMPGLSGLDCQRQLADAGIQVPIIFMSGHGDVPMSVRAMKAGAVDFLTKPFRDQDLLDAVQQALERDLQRRAEEQQVSGLRERFASLTAREREVMSWVVSGRLNKQIAAELGTSEITVKVHRGQVMRKMGADSLADLVRIAGRIGVAARQP
jgi:FixJ family two-component response regulator